MNLNDAHLETQEALPWLANGTLAGTELERVQAHLHGCAACRADLAQLHTLRAAGPAPEPDYDVDGALARLLPRLDEPALAPAPAPVPAGWRARLAANDRSWLRAAVAIQCCALAVLAVLLMRPHEPAADYRLLGATPGVQAGLVVTFAPETPERELRRIVLASGAHIVGGPTATGAWMLGTDDAPGTVVARLQAEPAVTLAQPLGGAGRP